MRLASYALDGRESFGVVVGSGAGTGIVDLQDRLRLPDTKALLAKGVEAARPFAAHRPDHLLTSVELRPPVTNPALVIGIGLNTHSHAREAAAFFGREVEVMRYPRLFLRTPMSHVGHGQALHIPRRSQSLDFEGEIAVVIGRGGRCIDASRALEHVAGIACYNDGSVRDYQRHSNQVTAGKNFVASGGFGPWLTTLDEAGPVDDWVMEARVNGELQQRLTMDDLIFGVADVIAYVSQPFLLQPGDVIAMGSPEGIGAIKGHYLAPGDVVEVTVPTVGTLRTPVIEQP